MKLNLINKIKFSPSPGRKYVFYGLFFGQKERFWWPTDRLICCLDLVCLQPQKEQQKTPATRQVQVFLTQFVQEQLGTKCVVDQIFRGRIQEQHNK